MKTEINKIPVIIIAPSAGHKNASSSVNVLLNIAGVEANLQNKQTDIQEMCFNKLYGKCDSTI